jgi:predicted NAD/FAD-binding protein
MKIAVIGAGIAGLSAAYFLARRHEVTLFEQDRRAGGHTNTFVAPDGQPVDTGFIVYNQKNYPNLSALFAELDVATQRTAMSFAVSLGGGAYEWKGSDNLLSVFAQPSNIFRPSHLRLIRDILKLNARCNALLAAGELPAGPLIDFLDAEGFGAELRSRYLLPMAGMIWSCSPRAAQDYPAADFMRFFDSHGLFTATNQPQWFSVKGGSSSYVQKLLAQFRGTLALGVPVESIARGADGVSVRAGGATTRFDRVVCACHADQALRLLSDASDAERAVLGGIPYTRNRTILHTDESFLPRRRAAWASWNYLHERDEIHDRPIMGSYWMNLLQNIGSGTNYIVTLNPTRPIDPGRILYETTYDHPHYTASAVQTHARLPSIQGQVWWAGAWTRYGFHEDGLASGLRAVAGVDRSALPAWASLS